MNVTPEEIVAELGRLEFETDCELEDLEHGIRRLAIDDPHGMGLGIDLIWTGSDIVATFGQGTVVDLPSDMSIQEFKDLLVEVIGQPSRERWSRSRNTLVVGARPNERKFASSKGLIGRMERESRSRTYLPYRPAPKDGSSVNG
jgi:hypothetical protein